MQNFPVPYAGYASGTLAACASGPPSEGDCGHEPDKASPLPPTYLCGAQSSKCHEGWWVADSSCLHPPSWGGLQSQPSQDLPASSHGTQSSEHHKWQRGLALVVPSRETAGCETKVSPQPAKAVQSGREALQSISWENCWREMPTTILGRWQVGKEGGFWCFSVAGALGNFLVHIYGCASPVFCVEKGWHPER